jgi:putative NADH-flavin reductase
LDGKKTQGNAVIIAARTTEDLASQLEKDLSGEKDWHDTVIEAYDRLYRENHEKQQERLKQLSAGREHPTLSVVGGTEGRALSAAEVQERVLRTKQIQAQTVQRQMIETQFAEKVERFNAKIGYDLRVAVEETDRDPSSARPVPPARPAGTPFRR